METMVICTECNKESPAEKLCCEHCGARLTKAAMHGNFISAHPHPEAEPYLNIPYQPEEEPYLNIPPPSRHIERNRLILIAVACICIWVLNWAVQSFISTDSVNALEIQNKQLAVLMEECNATDYFPEKAEIFVAMANLTGVETNDYIATAKLLENREFQLGILNIALQKNGGTDNEIIFDAMERICSVFAAVNHQDSWPNIYEVIFEKELSEITWQDMARIKYFAQDTREDTVTYSFSSPFGIDAQSFSESLVTVSYRHSDRPYYRGYSALIGCERIDTTAGLVPGDILGKPYRIIDGVVYEDKSAAKSQWSMTSLDRFAIAPALEELYITLQHARCGDLSGMANLRILHAKSWEPVGSQPKTPPDFYLSNLLNAPALKSVVLKGFSVIEDAPNIRLQMDIEIY